jgi:hypothetical protein
VFRKSFGGGDQFPIWCGRIFQHFEDTEAIPAGELKMLGFLDDRSGGGECVAENEIRQVGAVDSYCSHQESLLVGAKAHGHAAVVFDGWAGHKGVSFCTH